MKKSTRTIYGAILDTARRFNEPLPLLENSTLNEKFDCFKDLKPRSEEYPFTQYYCIGLKGVNYVLDTDSLVATKYREYNPRWASLLSHIPFIMRPVEEDLTAAERAPYRMRVIREFNGKFYACYYLKTLNLATTPVGVEHRKIIDGNVVPTAWTPTVADLNPVPLPVDPNQVIRTGDDYLAAVKRFQIDFSANDIQEILDVVNIIHGDPDKANITELGLVSGIDRTVNGDFNGIPQSYTEAVYAQITDFVKTTVSAPNALMGDTIYVDAGSNEPLIVVEGQ